MSKPKLLIADSNLARPWFLPVWNQFFDCEPYNPTQQYSSQQVVIIDDRYETAQYQQIKQQGHRIILPYLMDSNVHDTCETVDQEFVLRARDWVWIQESLHWQSRLDHVTRPASQPDHFFLMLINLRRDHRDQLCQAVNPYLQHSLYSYVERGIFLPGDDSVVNFPRINDRLYVPDWYAQTCFSLVSESFVTPQLFISEKIFKPLAYQHAAVVYGTPGTLAYLRDLGFETFAHRVDESYDTELDANSRLQKIVAVLEDLYQEFTRTGTVFQDTRTQEILAHNHARFFDANEIQSRFQTQVAEPILEFLQS